LQLDDPVPFQMWESIRQARLIAAAQQRATTGDIPQGLTDSDLVIPFSALKEQGEARPRLDPDPSWSTFRQWIRLGLDLELGKKVMSSVIEHWLELGAVRPEIAWTGNRPTIQMGGIGLFGALATQLFLAVARTNLAICSACAVPYIPQRRPSARHRNYCPACGHGMALADAARDYRRRKTLGSGFTAARGGTEPAAPSVEVAKRR